MGYRGEATLTVRGHRCRDWSLPPAFGTDERYYDRYPELRTALNHCRNPDFDQGGPWCYTADPGVRWEYCLIDPCQSPPPPSPPNPPSPPPSPGPPPATPPPVSPPPSPQQVRKTLDDDSVVCDSKTVSCTWMQSGWGAQVCVPDLCSTADPRLRKLDNTRLPRGSGSKQRSVQHHRTLLLTSSGPLHLRRRLRRTLMGVVASL
jgi:hypothetical protein